VSERRIPLSDIDYGPEENAAVLRVLANRWLTMGPEVQAFEAEFATMLGVKHAIAVANGTAALHLAFVAAGFGPGDEVIQPAINFVASSNLTVALESVPVFADVTGPGDPTLDPGEIERLITPRTRGVVVMHYGGYLCRMAEITEICRRHNLKLIEDACHAVGARYLDAAERVPHGSMAGAIGLAGCFSFFGNKNLAIGEGGMVATDDDQVAEKVRLLRSHGMTSMSWDRHRGHASSYDVVLNGYNYRLDEIRGSLGRVQLAKLEANNRRRGELVQAYREGLEDLHGWTIPFLDYEGDSAYHLMVVVAPDPSARKKTVDALRLEGIQTSMHYPCVADFTAFATTRRDGLTRSRHFAERAITLPLYPKLTEPEVEEIVAVIRNSAD